MKSLAERVAHIITHSTRLKPHHREAYILHQPWSDKPLSFAEIARLKGKSRQAVHAAYHEAIVIIREELEADQEATDGHRRG